MKGGVVLIVWAVLVSVATAQTLPSEPITLGGGRIVIGGDVAVAVAPADNGFFNYSSYEHTTLRQLRLGLSGIVRVTERVSVLGEMRSENLDHVAPFALYARIRPFAARRFDIQAGLIPPTFGAYSRRTYSSDNPLIGTPLAYQYLTSLRADSIPADASELFRMRARGWLSSFSVGNLAPLHGVPLVSGFKWDTGIQVSTGWQFLSVSGAVTNGTLSNPRVADDNAGKQIATRVAVNPVPGLIVGSSFARGEFLGRRVRSRIGARTGDSFPQIAHGLDAEYSRDHWMVRADAVLSEWRLPFAAVGLAPVPLRALATGLEGRYTFLPGFYGAARAEHLAFSRITAGTRHDEWDAPVSRLEVGGGYYLQRNLIARASLQFNARDGGRVRSARLLAAQFLFWF
jgi:hypothetical protein